MPLIDRPRQRSAVYAGSNSPAFDVITTTVSPCRFNIDQFRTPATQSSIAQVGAIYSSSCRLDIGESSEYVLRQPQLYADCQDEFCPIVTPWPFVLPKSPSTPGDEAAKVTYRGHGTGNSLKGVVDSIE
jgi:hypothetical protein